MRNLRLDIAYDGTDFCGWQRQPQKATVQGQLEGALAKITGEVVKLNGSGRTDAGVHAANQVANLRTLCNIPCENLGRALNAALPPTIRILRVEEAPANFHARYDVRAKTYRYRILQVPVCPPYLARFVYHEPRPLDHARMARAARVLEGEHDFTSFAASEFGRRPVRKRAEIPQPAVRRVYASRVLWKPRIAFLTYDIRGDGFLPHMVRNIAGTLLEVGRGRLEPADVEKILRARNRARAGPTAPPQGLWLVRVEY